ncbi:prepilin-type N-terminal cleavage/methylation domain-containing protein [Vibrio sp. T187]|uniref:PilW family protein n=1 Tax=Vibrio TaxID=662 RepID=UPI0010C9E13F|nr:MULTISPECIES: prepilin-type N-terminal cleavage/methylation domain-containing protein [Vibrio]MBW3696514.1 prepilin-type N-terminal cleavage/methylation domain-containing protein [Vibrio sp. T187]
MALSRGFTLIEMIVSLTLLGILSLGLMNFGVSSSTLYVESKHRISALEEARFVLTRFQRELANSVPLSARTLNDGRCLEYLSLEYVAEYNPDSIELDVGVLNTSIGLMHPISDELDVCTARSDSPCLIAIYPSSSEDLYLGSDVNSQIYSLNRVESGAIIINEPILTRPFSPSNRMFVYLPEANQFCIEDSEVQYYRNYALDSAGEGLNNQQASHTFASGVVEEQSFFNLGVDSTYSNTASIQFSLSVNNSSEFVEFIQNAQILNSH